MNATYEFLKAVIDTLPEHIVVIDGEGGILFVNHSWVSFSQDNSCAIKGEWLGVNYLRECDRAGEMGDEYGMQAASGIRSVVAEERPTFYFEYPCHGPQEKRWFMMKVTPLRLDEGLFFVISHTNITERKLAEELALTLSRIDGLTNIANRRLFDEFIDNEWKRCARMKAPVSLAIVDLDYFKFVNDTYGHQTGDECLRRIGEVLKKVTKRPGDLAARLGGDEFAIVFGNTTREQASQLVQDLSDTVRAMRIPNERSPIQPFLTVSIGLATLQPDASSTWSDLLRKADEHLYTAKERRDQISA